MLAASNLTPVAAPDRIGSAPKEETIYVHPGNLSCRVYALPYRLRYGQSPRDIAQQYQTDWAEIGQLKSDLTLRYIDPAYAHLREDIEGQMGGTFFTLVNGQLEHETEAQSAARRAEHYR